MVENRDKVKNFRANETAEDGFGRLSDRVQGRWPDLRSHILC